MDQNVWSKNTAVWNDYLLVHYVKKIVLFV